MSSAAASLYAWFDSSHGAPASATRMSLPTSARPGGAPATCPPTRRARHHRHVLASMAGAAVAWRRDMARTSSLTSSSSPSRHREQELNVAACTVPVVNPYSRWCPGA
jgi:hypothetical protein